MKLFRIYLRERNTQDGNNFMNIEAEQSSAALHIVSRYRDHVGGLFAILSYAINTKYSNMPKHSPVFSSRLIFS